MEICIFYTDGTYCCDTVEISFDCKKLKLIKSFGVSPNPVLVGTVNVFYELYETSTTFTSPLKITIVDQQGVQRIDVMNAVPAQISDTIPVNINTLQAGHYYTIFQMGNQIEIRPFVKQ